MTQTEKYQYPTDDRFRRIAAKIADRCMDPPKRIGVEGDLACPLGAYCGTGNVRPFSDTVAARSEMTLLEAFSFIVGFSGSEKYIDSNESFWRLGYAYRQRYTRLRP